MSKVEKREIKSVDNALSVLEVLGDIDGDIRLAHLSEKLNMNKALVYRILATFQRRGYVEQAKKTGAYRLGLGAYEVGQKFLSHMELLRLAKPVMESLVRECGETVYVAVPVGPDILLFDKTDTTNPVSIMSLVGRRYRLTRCAAGKVALAFNADLRESFSENEPASSEKTLDDIRQMGFSGDFDALGDGVASLAVPLLGPLKKTVGSLCLVGPQYRFADEKDQSELLPALKTAGQMLSCQLGFPGYHLS